MLRCLWATRPWTENLVPSIRLGQRRKTIKGVETEAAGPAPAKGLTNAAPSPTPLSGRGCWALPLVVEDLTAQVGGFGPDSTNAYASIKLSSWPSTLRAFVSLFYGWCPGNPGRAY
jgi:hypothetical protein